MIYDLFQQQAIEYIDQGHSVIVSAPTGAGKTVIAEHVIRTCLYKGERVIYTAPVKALSNQKFRDFQAENPDSVGILTGDVSLNAGAPVQIMTTEIFRNKLLEGDQSLADYTWVIFDEIHYLDDYERGTVWEESLIFFPDHMKFLGLSATVPNVESLVQWLETIHTRKIKIVRENKRPVPLHFFYQCQGKVFDSLNALRKHSVMSAPSWHRKVSLRVPLKPNKLTTLIKTLDEEDKLPCLYFVFSRKRAQQLAEELWEFNFLREREREQIVEKFKRLCERFDIVGEPSAEEIRPLIERGIAYHHAGMLPTLKEVVEQLFTSRLIKVIFTTETFALGINMPARSVVFDELRKFYGDRFDALRTRDFYQMAGRAGRRSIDKEGFVYCRVNPHYISFDELHRVVNGHPEEVRSQFSASYATLLNLYRIHREHLYEIYPRSFHYFQTRKSVQKRALDRMRAKVDIMKELNYIKGEGLTEKGEFAREIYGYEMIFGELYGDGLLGKFSVEELGILAVASVYEPRKGQNRPDLFGKVRKLDEICFEIIRPVHRLERMAGFRALTKRPFFHLAEPVREWMRGAGFNAMMSKTDVDEGEVVRYFRMAIQVLRQMTETNISPDFNSKLYRCMELMKRDVIDSEKQLRS
ncbi:MAG: DEAD/DEAH box helicase [Candidatus Omnitrophota bacterium]